MSYMKLIHDYNCFLIISHAFQVSPVGSNEIQKKFDSLLEFLNKRPGLTVSLRGTSAQDKPDQQPSKLPTNFINSSQDSSGKSSQVSNCEAATAALASLNDFLEKFIAHKRQQPIESNDSSSKNLLNFKLCEITNEQQQLMKQALEMVKAKSSKSCTGDSCSAVNQVPAPDDNNHFTSAKYSSPELLRSENHRIQSNKNWQETTWKEVPYSLSPNLNPASGGMIEQSRELLSRSSAICDYWDSSKKFYQGPSGLNQFAREYSNHKRTFLPQCGSISRESALTNHFCHRGGAHRSERYRQTGNFSQFHDYRRMYNNNSFGGWWRGHGR